MQLALRSKCLPSTCTLNPIALSALDTAVCEGPPPALPRNTWPSTCTNAAVGSSCNGQCEGEFEGTPVASCPSKRQGWVVSGECQLARCRGPLPDVANATWASYCAGQTVGECHMQPLGLPATPLAAT